MIPRHITPQLQKLSRQFPVVTVTGPRQSGKTTLVRSLFTEHQYINLEDRQNRELAEHDYKAFFSLHSGPLILDEIQRVPQLLSAIQVLVDEKREPGKYILTGSHQPLLQAEISQSLAGRTALLRLLPLSIAELADADVVLERDEYLTRGFLPGQYAHGLEPAALFSAYYATYVERDARQLVNIGKQQAFELFVKLLAGRVGQLVNLQSMAGDIGVSAPTLASWLSVLEACFIVFRLPPYFRNFGKRLVKTPKIYFTETGLAAWLLGIATPEQASRDPLFGNLYENVVVAEALKARSNAGFAPELYFYRDKSGLEIDLLLNQARRLRAMEIKGGMTYSDSLADNVRKFKKIAGEMLASSAVIYAGDVRGCVNGTHFINFRDTEKLILSEDP
ncbi:MAG: ATP-binding protein [Desulfobulbaceae bacterium]|jgi:predicted AAA+ superfamily ATPase|nr:ATP-binding protein [Desulfobulbaceae bacterium]